MIGGAKSSRVLYDDLRALGFDDTEFPDWWYSPARDNVDSTRSETIENDVVDPKSIPSSDSDVLTPAIPKNPIPIERVPGRPVFTETNESNRTAPPGSRDVDPNRDGTGFTQEESRILGENKIFRSDDGVWRHVEQEPSGRTIITPVNPIAELRRLTKETQGNAILDNVNKNMIEMLEISTQSIIKKVALNPTVFWIHQYVTSVKDQNTGLPLFTGDIGDFLSFCVRFTGEAYYGVVPTYVTNRPSFLTSLNQQNRRATYPNQDVTYNQFLNQNYLKYL